MTPTMESLLREAMADPARLMSHDYRTTSPGYITHDLPHRPGCLRCRVEEALGERVLNASERYQLMLDDR